MDIATLWVMQEELRHPIAPLIDTIKDGVVIEPLDVVEFEDGVRMIHNGHHRAVAAYLAGRTTLNPVEYNLHSRTYERYMFPMYDIGYVTPFDPRIEVRIPDFMWIKQDILLAIAESRLDAAVEMIQAKKFARPRKIKTVAELARSLA
jgi:ParB-like nuclease domain